MQYARLPDLFHNTIYLRPLLSEDIEDWFKYLSNPLVFTHTSWNVQSPSDLAHNAWNDELANPSSPVRFAIARRVDDLLVGTAGFHTVSAENRTAELAYDLSPEFWGQGIATAAAGELVRWAHECAGIIRVQATVLDSNTRSSKVLLRLGFKPEGLLRSYRLVRGAARNFNMYSHLANETTANPSSDI